MTDNINPDESGVKRLSRLSSTPGGQPAAGEGDTESVVREYEERYQKLRREPTPRSVPRSYRASAPTPAERRWSAVAHASAWLTLLGGFATLGISVPFSIFIPLALYLVFRKKSDYVAFHALQAFVLQLVGTVGAALLLSVGGVVWLLGLFIALLLVALAVGVVLVPLWAVAGLLLLLVVFLLPIAMLLYSTIGTLETANGRDYRYPVIARWIDRQLAGELLAS
ncbi:MAG: DUF4870 domain-containing protein [Chloroflexi bacterium]|nr:DUF4870 domain-containing protein [Chloroflexota bacterium]